MTIPVGGGATVAASVSNSATSTDVGFAGRGCENSSRSETMSVAAAISRSAVSSWRRSLSSDAAETVLRIR